MISGDRASLLVSVQSAGTVDRYRLLCRFALASRAAGRTTRAATPGLVAPIRTAGKTARIAVIGRLREGGVEAPPSRPSGIVTARAPRRRCLRWSDAPGQRPGAD